MVYGPNFVCRVLDGGFRSQIQTWFTYLEATPQESSGTCVLEVYRVAYKGSL